MFAAKHICLIILVGIFGQLNAQDYSIYVSDAGNYNNPPWQIIKYDANGENPVKFISDQLAWPQDILFLEDKNEVLISNLNSGRICRHNATTGAYINNFASGLSGPTRMKIGADGLLYVLQWNGSGHVNRYQLDGTFVDVFTSDGLPQSIGLDWDTDGNLYVSSYKTDNILKYAPDGQLLTTFVSNNLVGPTNIWFGENDTLYVADYDGGAIKRFDKDGNYLGVFINGLKNSEGIDFLGNGNILIGNGGTAAVKEYTAEGKYVQDIVASGLGNLLIPNAVVIRQSPNSIEEKTSVKNPVIHPTIGSTFHLKHLEKIKNLSVYDLSGKLIQTINKTSFWDANNLTEGAYLVVIQWNNSSTTFEKIVVKH